MSLIFILYFIDFFIIVFKLCIIYNISFVEVEICVWFELYGWGVVLNFVVGNVGVVFFYVCIEYVWR